jgi:3-deoxy-7-phosphoheptulonate synthase
MKTPEPKMKVSRESQPEMKGIASKRVIRVGNVEIGGSRPIIIAGPCAVESRNQTLEIAKEVRDAGADMLRGGAYKPRTSPYSFQGLGEKGLEILAEAREATGLPVVSEVMDPRLVEVAGVYVDVLQIGSRNMHCSPILIEVGKYGKPVLLKRGWCSTLTEWLYAAEYIADQGNLDIIMCERGIRSFTLGEYSRNTMDLSVVPALQARTFLPVIVDPSHAAGDANLVPALSRSALGAGVDGLMIEVIGSKMDRNKVLSDGDQCILPAELREIVSEAHGLAAHCARTFASLDT